MDTFDRLKVELKRLENYNQNSERIIHYQTGKLVELQKELDFQKKLNLYYKIQLHSKYGK